MQLETHFALLFHLKEIKKVKKKRKEKKKKEVYFAGHVAALESLFLGCAEQLKYEIGGQIHELLVVFEGVETVEEIASRLVILVDYLFDGH